MGRAGLVTVLAAVAAVVPTAAPARTGEPAQEQPPFRSGVDVVEIDVTVTARRGRQPVTDLGASDFRVRIGGRPRRVAQARLVSPATTRPPRASRAAPPPGPEVLYTSNAALGRGGGRLIVLVVDPESIPFGVGRSLLRTAGAFVTRLHPEDQVALIEVPGPSVLVAPTEDHGRVGREVARLGGLGEPRSRILCAPTGGRVALFEAFRIAVYGQEDALREAVRRIFFFLDGRVACPAIDPEALKQRVEFEAARIVQESRVRTRQAVRGIESLLRSLRGTERHKTLVWVSGGLASDTDATLVRGIEEEAAASRANLVALMVPEPDIDIEGRGQNPRPPYLRNQDRLLLEQGLSAAADATGGEFYRALGNGRGLFERIEAQLAGHYRLAVEVGPGERVDRSRVDVAVARRDAQARVRHAAAASRGDRDVAPGGAAASPAGVAGRSADERLIAMLRSPAAESWLPLRVSTYAYPDGGGRARVAVTAEVGGGGVDGSEVTLGYALLDSWGAVVSSGRQRVVGTAAGRRDDGRYAYRFPVTSAPGRYALRVAAVDGRGRGGSVEHPLRVGLALSDAPLALGALEVSDPAGRTEGRAADGDGPVVSSGELAVALDVHAESAWVFGRIRVAVEVARDRTSPALVRAEAPLRGRDDAPRRSAAVRLPVGELLAGSYVARVRLLRGTDVAAKIERRFRIAE